MPNGRRGRTTFTGLCLALSLVACRQQPTPCPQKPGAAPDGTAPYGQVWVATRVNVQGIQEVDPQAANPFFDVPGSYVIESGDVWPWASASRRTAYWASGAEFEADVRSQGGTLPGVQAALYDPEAWAATPAEEQRDPASAIEGFAALAHREGWDVVVTPGLTLPSDEGAVCAKEEGESDPDAYLRCEIAGSAAAHADVVEIQAQTLQGDPDAYRNFVKEATAQARAANPQIKVLSGLRIRDPENLEEVKRAWAATAGVVDGHYLAVNPFDAAALLEWISTCAAAG